MRKINWTFATTVTVVYMFMIGAAAISFSHIVDVFGTLGLGWEKYTVPFFIDGLAILGKIGRSERFAASTRSAGLKLMAGAGALSLACNIYAGDNDGQRIYGALVVAGFITAEWYSAKLQPAPITKTEGAKLDPQVAKERAEKAKATKERKRLEAMTPAEKAKATKARKAAELAALEAAIALPDAPVSPAPITN